MSAKDESLESKSIIRRVSAQENNVHQKVTSLFCKHTTYTSTSTNNNKYGQHYYQYTGQ